MLWRGLRISAAPEVQFLLRATSRFELVPGPIQAQIRALKPLGAIFEHASGRTTTDVTGSYERWFPALSFGLSWEHAYASHGWRVEGDFHTLLIDPTRSAARARMHASRLGVVGLR